MVFLGCLLLTVLLLGEAWALDMNCESGKFGIDCRGTCHCKSQKDCDSYGTCQNQCELDWDGPTCQRHNIIPDKYRIYKCGYLKVPVKIILQKSQKIHNLYFEILISVNETSPAKWCFGKVLAQPTSFNCSSVIEGQYIHIYSSKRNIFVCKIKIYECADFFFGDQCKHECHCANKSELCNKTNGLCLSSGCPGWYSDCFTKCPDYSFGNNCSKQCHCLNNEICDRVTGLCPSGCSPGWKHMDCGTPCDDFFFAQNCSQECKCLNASEVCDKETGQCQSSCRPGWHGNNSSLACADSSYEHNCSDGCQCNNSSETCGNETEQPVSGCQDDWLGNNCSARLQARKTAMIAGITTGVGTVIVLIFAALVVVRRRQRKTCRRRDQVMTDETYYKSLSTRGTNQKNDNENNQRDEASCASMYINTNLDVEMYVNAGSVAMVSNMESSIDKTGEAVKMVDLFEHVKTKRSSPSDLFDEYKNLPEGPVKKCQVGKLMENKFKNRFRNIIPYDDTRVVLQPDSDDSQSDYINASLIYGYNSRVRYIASQGVLATSLKDFWRMVWQQDCGKIVMLTNLFENGTIKCEQYWPDEHKKSYGSITVKLICCQEFADFKIRKFSVSKLNVNEVKTVEQFHFTTWTDHSLLKIPGKLVVFYQKIINAQSQQTGPILVHCSAGIGRTGIFLALDYLVSQAAADGVVDFFGCVHKLLQQKAVLIQNELQYAFLHDVVVEAVLFSGNTIPLQDFPAVFQQLGKHDLIKEFELLDKKIIEHKPQVTEAVKNAEKNRTMRILASEEHRPFLSTSKENCNNYINAVYVSSFREHNAFLITQMPLKTTVMDLWRLVYDTKAKTIIILNEIENNKKNKMYWPENGSSTSYGSFFVESKTKEHNSDFSVITLTLCFNKNLEDTLTVKIFQSHFWPENQDTPEAGQFLSFYNAVKEWKGKRAQHVVVQCMNGADKSGLFCSLWNILEQAETDNEVNILQIVRQLKFVRKELVHNQIQYNFCYTMVNAFLEQNQIYVNIKQKKKCKSAEGIMEEETKLLG